MFAGFLTMRRLHKPVHPAFIFSSDWAKMTEEEREKATKEGKLRLPSPKEYLKLKNTERNELRVKFKPYFEEIREDALQVLRTFPKGLIFVCRYIYINLFEI
jgi:hypothetical protein